MTSSDKMERLWQRAWAILDGEANGFGEPILWHLALRRYPAAMVELASRLTVRHRLGRVLDPFSPAGLYRRAYRMGNSNAAQNLAMAAFNRVDLANYRYWLRKTAQAGDGTAAIDLRRFEIRLAHRAAHEIRRGRMYRNYDYGTDRATWRKRHMLNRS